jgi:hypothetical protein
LKRAEAEDLERPVGNTVAYTIDGSMTESVDTMNIDKRTDGKSDCVWSGRSFAHTDQNSHGLIGNVRCDGNVWFVIRVDF